MGQIVKKRFDVWTIVDEQGDIDDWCAGVRWVNDRDVYYIRRKSDKGTMEYEFKDIANLMEFVRGL